MDLWILLLPVDIEGKALCLASLVTYKLSLCLGLLLYITCLLNYEDIAETEIPLTGLQGRQETKGNHLTEYKFKRRSYEKDSKAYI